MQFVINRDYFVHSVQHVTKAISSRTTIPILTGIKIVADHEGVTLTGSDSDISIECVIPIEEDGEQLVQIIEEGSIVLQAKFFAEIVKKLPEDKIELVVQDQFATTLRSGSSVFNLNGLDPEEYPRLPQIEEENLFQIQNDLMKNIIRQTVFAVSTAETRPILTGVNWQVENKQLTCTATDSHRLAIRKAAIETNIENLTFNNIVIPGKSLTELSKIIDDNDGLLDIVVTENQILFKSKNLLFFSRLLDGNYPATKNMIPDHSKTDIFLETKGFLQAIERALLLSRDGKNNVVNFKTLEDGIVEITSVTPEIGRVTERINTKQLNGEELRISFNGKNIIDALKIVDSNEIKISFTGAMSPFLLRPVDSDKALHLFSPVRTY
ncbi:DNA polymerase III subunit beta [Anaerobacillus isosaccharinicus]|uniref:Beta sliding clamp n=1 Tax=Anaerobacillus isosaccharinicus TaxID=1532552 RepID=A0A1S2MFJ3_9BACI|nr:DNA polymerase III subunit beta [Anaerobacillus isosaccharinicus]MBA5584207.1 DNA polymerase III subunit beta [Anaerobacillus isosaccharinicus]QOY37390.1 DNA polymerase III subunit beta [Anaerobacillus isosaccharinicus]